MTVKSIEAFKYAITTGDIKLFDELAKDFASYDRELKEEIITNSVMFAPDTDFLKHIIEKYDYDIHFRDKDGLTLLHWAACSNYPQTVKFFLEKGLDIEDKTEPYYQTPFLSAAKYSDNPEVLKTLIDAGANIKAVDVNGETALISAAGRNPVLEITKFLLNLGFDPEERDDEGYTALLNAARWQSNTEIIDLLVEAGADTTVKTYTGDTMFHLAVYNESPVIAGYIQDLFSTSQTNDAGETCLETALLHANNPMVINYYLMKMKNEHMQYACMNENPEILEALILAGYNASATDDDGKTIMMTAANLNTNPAIIKMLRFYNAVWNNSDNKGRTVLHYAAANLNPAIYNWMMEDECFQTLADCTDKDGNKAEYYLSHKEMCQIK